jgi:hypothetical protein
MGRPCSYSNKLFRSARALSFVAQFGEFEVLWIAALKIGIGWVLAEGLVLEGFTDGVLKRVRE